MAWDDYARIVERQLADLLDAGECRESSYQHLIEHHPSLLPWVYGTFGGGHHGLVHGAIISQPRLPGIDGKQPDFMMIARDSGSVYAVLVELESPCKPWFTKSGQPTAKLTQAMSQLRAWKAWFDQPGKTESFIDEYRVPHDWHARRVEIRCLLVYGRRSELNAHGYGRLRSHHQAADERFMSYDHLRPTPQLRDAVTVRVSGSGYHALSLPPTLQMGPFQASDLVHINSKDAAVLANPLMTRERAEFLKSRFAYWDAWASNPDGGPHGFEVE